MAREFRRRFTGLLGLAFLLCGLAAAQETAAALPMRAGVATETITPQEMPFWLSGYAARTRPAETVAQDLFAKALAVEDPQGKRAVLVTLDVIGIPRELRDEVAAELEKTKGVSPESVLINCSHTHSGPAIRDNLEIMFAFDEAERAKVQRYRNFLRRQIVKAATRALDGMKPARIEYAEGTATFAINRRAARLKQLNPEKEPSRVVDHSVPVLRVEDSSGALVALVFGYACHNTTLTGQFYEISGDYAGHAQAALEKAHPGATAMFLMLCGGDQNPDPRSKVELAPAHGNALAKAVEAAVAGPRVAVEGAIRTGLVDARLPFAPRSKRSLEEELRHEDRFRKARAKWVLAKMDKGEDVSSIRYPVQALRIGDDLAIVALGGEVVVDYALAVKREFAGRRVIVAGYSNDVMCYIPSLRILREGGYEGGDSMKWYGLDAPFAEDVEERVTDTVAAVMQRVRK